MTKSDWLILTRYTTRLGHKIAYNSLGNLHRAVKRQFGSSGLGGKLLRWLLLSLQELLWTPSRIFDRRCTRLEPHDTYRRRRRARVSKPVAFAQLQGQIRQSNSSHHRPFVEAKHSVLEFESQEDAQTFADTLALKAYIVMSA